MDTFLFYRNSRNKFAPEVNIYIQKNNMKIFATKDVVSANR